MLRANMCIFRIYVLKTANAVLPVWILSCWMIKAASAIQ